MILCIPKSTFGKLHPMGAPRPCVAWGLLLFLFSSQYHLGAPHLPGAEGEQGYRDLNKNTELQCFVTVALLLFTKALHCVSLKKRWQWRKNSLVNFFQTQAILRIVIWTLGSSLSVWRPQIFRFMPKTFLISIIRHMQLQFGGVLSMCLIFIDFKRIYTCTLVLS